MAGGDIREFDAESIHSVAPPGRPAVAWLLGLAALGLVAAALHALLIEDGYRRFMLAYLVAFAFVLSLTLGAMAFVLIQHLTRAGWSVLVRRPAEVLSANMPILAVLFIPIAVSVLVGGGEIYPWAQPEAAAVERVLPAEPLVEEDEAGNPAGPANHDPPALGTFGNGDSGGARPGPGYEHQQLDDFTLSKRAYLNAPFFILRWVAFLGIWAWAGWFFWRHSIRQDQSGDPALTVKMERWAGPVAVLLAFTLTFAAKDLLVTLNPHWYSTIFGIYYFSGAIVGALSVLVIAIVLLRRAGLVPRETGEEHFLDLGRLLFAFVFFWGYIAFSQYMLLWYANVPEMTAWLRIRGATTVPEDVNAWSIIALVLLVGHFFVPFCVLMTRHSKRRPLRLAIVAAWLLVMHYLDLAWVVLPELGPALTLGGIEAGLMLTVGCIYALAAWRVAAGHRMVPARDPRLDESILHEPLY